MSETQRRRPLRLSLLAVPALAATASVLAAAPAPAATTESLYSSSSSVGTVDSDTGSVNLGVRFTPKVNGSVNAVEFYRGSTADTAKTVDLWDATTKSRIGRGTLSSSLTTGWTRVALSSAVNVTAAHTYVASVLAPVGRYNAINWGFTSGRTVGDLSVPSNGGVYTYAGSEAFPTSTWNSSEYLVSPVFAPSGSTSTTSPTPTPTSTATPTSSATPTTTATATPTPTATATPTSTATSTPTASASSSPTSTSTSSSAYSCVQTTAQGKCYYPSDQYITGASGAPYVNQNIWNGSSSYQQTLYAASPENWYVMANANTNFGGVLSYPNVGFNMSGTVDGKASVTSSWNTSFPHNAQTAAWAAYDLWLNNWADEVMIQTDISANSYYNCTAVASATFSGQPWHMCQFGAERVWKPGTDDSHLANQASGTVDIKAILVWMEQHGYLPTSSTWTAGSYGYEVCDTGGLTEKFSVNGFTWTAK